MILNPYVLTVNKRNNDYADIVNLLNRPQNSPAEQLAYQLIDNDF